MKIATIIVRVLLGLLLVFGSVAFFFKLFPVPELQGAIKEFNEGVTASGYLMQLIKGAELLCGLAFLVGFFVPLATVVMFPISVNIFLVHAFIVPEGLPVAIFVLAANLFLAYVHRAKYKGLLEVK